MHCELDMEKVVNFLIIGLGGFLGSAMRYGVSLVVQGGSFPIKTLSVNVIGALLMGCIVSYFTKNEMIGSPLFLFLTVGMCGGFTTFSAFSMELFEMIRVGNYYFALLYVALSVVLSLAATVCGYYLIKYIN